MKNRGRSLKVANFIACAILLAFASVIFASIHLALGLPYFWVTTSVVSAITAFYGGRHCRKEWQD